MKKFAMAGIQMNATNGDNLDNMTRLTELAKKRYPWIELVMFGELSAFGTSLNAAQPMPGPAENHFCSLAKKHDIWILPGSFYEMDDDKIYNTTPVINPDGEVITRHRKLFPFEPYETEVEAGVQHTVFDIPGVGRFGVSICYDMWFPETIRALTFQGAEAILHPTLTSTIDRELELSIARSSATTNQCYFIDMNSCGDLANGKSILVGPDGDILHQSQQQEEIVPVIMDLERVRHSRKHGVMGLGQPLKSFRDHPLDFPQYSESSSNYLDSLGELVKPERM